MYKTLWEIFRIKYDINMNQWIKIIFLDIDWVLIRIWWWVERVSRNEKWKNWLLTEFELELVNNLVSLIRATWAKIVISSSWRHIPDILYKSWNEAWLNSNLIIWFTPSWLWHWRWNEILTWINEWHKTCPSQLYIKNWIAIDDDSADMKSINRLWRFIHTKSNQWLTKEKTQEAISILNS